MNFIAIDTANEHLLIVAYFDGAAASYYSSDCKLKHSQNLLPCLEAVLEKSGKTFLDADAFIAVTGPGSFTGIRIGTSTVKAFGDVFEKPVYGVTSFDVLAYNKEGSKKLTVIDAGHEHYYACGYNEANIIDIAPKFISAKELDELKKDRLILTFKPLEGIKSESCDLVTGLTNAALSALNKAAKKELSEGAEPFYLRLSQAEEGRK